MEGALVGGAVTEERHGDVVLAGDHGAQRGAGGDRQSSADDAVGAEDAERVIDDMHRAALAFAVAGALAENLRHHAIEASALGDQMSVAAMVRGDAIGLAQRGADAGGGSFFADGDVDEAGKLGRHRQVSRLGFEMPDLLHRAVHLEQLVLADIHEELASVKIAGDAR